MKSNNIQLDKVEPNGVEMTLIYRDSTEAGIMNRVDSDNLVKEQVQAAQTLLDQMNRTATVYARRRERLNSVIRARKTRQHVAWASAARERRLHG